MPQTMPRVKWLGLALIAGVVIGALVWALGDASHVEVTTAQVTSGPVARMIVATGTLQALTTVQVGSQVSGNISELDADFNSIVKKGQVIAKLDPSLVQAQLDQSKASLTQASANLEKARSDLQVTRVQLLDAQQKFTRAKALADNQLELPSDLDAAQIAVDSAKAALASQEATVVQSADAVAQAEALVRQNQVNVDFCVIRAPIDGIIIQRSVDIGQTVAASMQTPTLFIIAGDLTKMQMEVDLDESDIAGPTAGDPVTFQVEAYPGETFQGTVAQVRIQPVSEQSITATAVGGSSTAPAATTSVATVVGYPTMITVDNPDERLRPGMTATVAVGGAQRENVVRIPNNALTFRPGQDIDARGLVVAIDDRSQRQDAGDAKPRVVWRFDGRRFLPSAARTGLAGQQWTELVSGPLRPGDSLVTNAVLRKSSRLLDLLHRWNDKS